MTFPLSLSIPKSSYKGDIALFDEFNMPPVKMIPLWVKENDALRHVYFQLACTQSHFCVKFHVLEGNVKALHTNDGDPVWKDSCVELFIQPDDEGYYNFEVNAIGRCLSEYGIGRANRTLATTSIYEQIVRVPSLGQLPFEERLINQPWQLFLAVPFDVIGGKSKYSQKVVKANFTKCGSSMVQPHYLSWSVIKTDTPDFHRPEYFGNLIFPKL